MDVRDIEILIVEDEEVFRMDLRRRLDRLPRIEAHLVFRETLAGARGALHEYTFDVGLFDYSLPDGESLELVEEVSTRLRSTIAPIIITANDDVETRDEILAAGAQDYLIKGEFDDDLLERSILFALERRRGTHLRRRLDRAERLAQLGKLAADIAHQFNNPSSILGNNLQFERRLATQLERLSDRAADVVADDIARICEDWREMLEESGAALRRITRLVDDAQLLGAPTPEQVRPCAVNEVIRSAAHDVLDPESQVSVDVELADVPLISADVVRLRRALLSAIENAVEAAALGDGAAEVSISTLPVEQGVQITVQDTGPGIAEEEIGNVFRPYYSNKPPSKGTGLGLPIVLSVVHAHGGTVDIDSTDAGARLRIWLPADAGGMGDTPVESLYGDTEVDIGAS